MYYWVLGFNESGVKSLAGPFRERGEADKGTQTFVDKKIYSLNTPDRQEAMTALANKPSGKPTRQVEVKDADEDEGNSDYGIGEQFSGGLDLDF